jgi:NIMA (never in mitosis gene a)-related kinase
VTENPRGTPNYLAPEIWNGEPYNTRSDLWALGCILYELCTLKVAFPGRNHAEVYVKIDKGNYDPILDNLPYSDKLRKLVDLLLQKDSKLRPQAARIPTMPLSELQI